MAAWFDLIHRVEALEERGLTVATDYHGQGLPKWLLPALGDCDIFVLNAKNVPTDNTLCIVRLARLERLLTEGDFSQLVAESDIDNLLASIDVDLDNLLADFEEP